MYDEGAWIETAIDYPRSSFIVLTASVLLTQEKFIYLEYYFFLWETIYHQLLLLLTQKEFTFPEYYLCERLSINYGTMSYYVLHTIY